MTSEVLDVSPSGASFRAIPPTQVHRPTYKGLYATFSVLNTLSDLKFFVCVGAMNICVCMCAHLCVYVHVEVRGQDRVSSLIVIFLRQGLLLSLDFLDHQDSLASESQGSSPVYLPSA